MTTPTPDSSGNITPGHYHAEGDPPGTVRYWDGTQWSGAPVPSPPSGAPFAPPGAGLPAGTSAGRPAETGVRIGAILIDGIIMLVISVIVTLPFLEDTNPDSNAFEFQATGIETVLGPLVVLGIIITMVATLGATIGKLILGLRITTENGTTPPGFGPAIMRILPWLPTLIPALGIVVWLGVVIASLVMMSNDYESRSIFDRVANTRVVHKT